MINLTPEESSIKHLSKKEAEFVPCWAVYFSPDENDVLFLSEDKSKGQWLTEDSELESGFDLQDPFDVTNDQLALVGDIYRIKPFDITKHKFSDRQSISCTGKDEGLASLCFEVQVFHDRAEFNLDKQDAIAIAKALGVTWEDLS